VLLEEEEEAEEEEEERLLLACTGTTGSPMTLVRVVSTPVAKKPLPPSPSPYSFCCRRLTPLQRLCVADRGCLLACMIMHGRLL
jgi:hypothetical protein